MIVVNGIVGEEKEKQEQELEQEKDIQPKQREPLFFSWNDQKLNLQLIDIWQKHSSKFSSGQFRKNQVWKIINDELKSNIEPRKLLPTTNQCMGRWKTMLRTYRKCKDHNSKFQNDRRTCPYFSEFDNLYKDCPTIYPEAIASTTTIIPSSQITSTFNKTFEKVGIVVNNIEKERIKGEELTEEEDQLLLLFNAPQQQQQQQSELQEKEEEEQGQKDQPHGEEQLLLLFNTPQAQEIVEKEEEEPQQQQPEQQQVDKQEPLFLWSNRELNLQLIYIWQKHSSKFSSGIFKKNQVWKIIHDELRNNIESGKPLPTINQCMNRWKTMLRSYKKCKDHNKKSWNRKRTCPYFSEFDNINLTPTPMALSSSTRISSSSHTSVSSAGDSPPRKKYRSSGILSTNSLIDWLESWKQETIEREREREERQRVDLERKLQMMERLANEKNAILKDILETLRKR